MRAIFGALTVVAACGLSACATMDAEGEDGPFVVDMSKFDAALDSQTTTQRFDSPFEAALDAQYAEGKSTLKYEAKTPRTDVEFSVPAVAYGFGGLEGYFIDELEGIASEVEDASAGDERTELPAAMMGSESWTIDGQSGDMLALSADWYSYTGGAHGMYGRKTLLYTANMGALIEEPGALFSNGAATQAFQKRFCALLDAERERRRGEPVDRSDMFGECVDPFKQTIGFRSTNGKMDRILVFVGPYVAGPYAESSYSFDMPMTQALIDAYDPDYRYYFAPSSAPAITLKP